MSKFVMELASLWHIDSTLISCKIKSQIVSNVSLKGFFSYNAELHQMDVRRVCLD